MKIDEILKTAEKHRILNELLDFTVDMDGVVYDEEGDEFHGSSRNDIYDFKDLKGIIEYIKDESFDKGVRHNQNKIKKALNL